jgi:alpha-ketoglutarate-dependent taurine dioxygenase
MNAVTKVNIEILMPMIGARIEGVNLSETLDDRDIAEIRRLFLTHRVIFFENQNLSPVRGALWDVRPASILSGASRVAGTRRFRHRSA